MELPSVLAWPEEEALSYLRRSGWKVRLKETGPPRPVSPVGRRRILRLRLLEDGSLELLVGREGLGEGGS